MPKKEKKPRTNSTTEEAKNVTKEFVFQRLDEKRVNEIMLSTYSELCDFLKIHKAEHSARTTQLKMLKQNFYLLKTDEGYFISKTYFLDLKRTNNIITQIDEFSKYALLCLLYNYWYENKKNVFEITVSGLAKDLGFISDEFNQIRNGKHKYAARENIPKENVYEFIDKTSKFYNARLDKVLRDLLEKGYIQYSKKMYGRKPPKKLVPQYGFDEFNDYTYSYEEGEKNPDIILTDDELSVVEEIEKDVFFQVLNDVDYNISDYKEKRDNFISGAINRIKKEGSEKSYEEKLPMQMLYKKSCVEKYYQRRTALILKKLNYLFVYDKYTISFNEKLVLSLACCSAYAFDLINKRNPFDSENQYAAARKEVNKMVIKRLSENKEKQCKKEIKEKLELQVDTSDDIEDIKKEYNQFKKLTDVLRVQE